MEYIEYLRAAASSAQIEEIKRKANDSLELASGSHVLDIGCGPGIDTIPLGRVVGPGGRVVGIDRDLEMVAAASSRAKEEQMERWVEHLVANSMALPCQTGYFDAVRCERLFQHLALPEVMATLSEIRRVTRLDARLVFVDTDWGSLSIDTPYPWIERAIVAANCFVFVNAFSGRTLQRLVKEAGFEVVKGDAFTVPLSYKSLVNLLRTAENLALMRFGLNVCDLQFWHASLIKQEIAGELSARITMHVVRARR